MRLLSFDFLPRTIVLHGKIFEVDERFHPAQHFLGRIDAGFDPQLFRHELLGGADTRSVLREIGNLGVDFRSKKISQ